METASQTFEEHATTCSAPTPKSRQRRNAIKTACLELYSDPSWSIKRSVGELAEYKYYDYIYGEIDPVVQDLKETFECLVVNKERELESYEDSGIECDFELMEVEYKQEDINDKNSLTAQEFDKEEVEVDIVEMVNKKCKSRKRIKNKKQETKSTGTKWVPEISAAKAVKNEQSKAKKTIKRKLAREANARTTRSKPN